MTRRNLPPEAEAWGRSVDTDMLDMKRDLRVLKQETANAFKGINGALSGIANQVQALDQLTAELQAQQDVLAQQQASLTELVNSQLSVRDVKASPASGFAISTTETTRASNSITVPNGYTQCLFICTGRFAAAGDGNANLVYGRLEVGDGPWTGPGESLGGFVTNWIALESSGSIYGAQSIVFMDRLTGLTGGQTIPFRIKVWSSNTSISASSWNQAGVNAAAIFLR